MNLPQSRWTISFASFLMCSVVIGGEPEAVFPEEEWERVTHAEVAMRNQPLQAAREYALTAGGSGMVVRHGRVAIAWGDTKRKHDLKSTSKSIGITALGLAIDDGKMAWSDPASRHHPDLDKQDSREITLRQLANHSAGFAKPGGYSKLLFPPGTRWHYSDCGPNWLAECVTLATQQDIQTLLFERAFTKMGISSQDLHWRNHAYREHKIGGLRRYEFGSGVHANVEAMARIGLLYLRLGMWKEQRLLSERFVRDISSADSSIKGLAELDDEHGNASEHYGLLWWNNADGAIEGVPADAYWSWGLHDSLIVVIPSLDVVASRVGKSWKRKSGDGHYDVLAAFLQPIVAATQQSSAPYPPSELGRIRWASPDSIRRFAPGSDNWPITWMDNDQQLTAYGDGWGFKPRSKSKLSLGFARIEGTASDFQGFPVRSPTGEQAGQGKDGVKASGLLMVEGVVYMLARNAGNSQLAWSVDRGNTWQWSDWKFQSSFGCPSFVNFGRNYEGARDDFVYVVSPDSESAYRPADQMVMARVPRKQIKRKEAYQFFSGWKNQQPTWSANVVDRAAIFKHPGRCYRGGMTYNPGLKRYLWCQVMPESQHEQGPRFQGGFGVYDAPQPWGPWTTVFFDEDWDVGPGESSRLPTKWFSSNGKVMHLLFSGEDAFSVRRGELTRD